MRGSKVAVWLVVSGQLFSLSAVGGWWLVFTGLLFSGGLNSDILWSDLVAKKERFLACGRC